MKIIICGVILPLLSSFFVVANSKASPPNNNYFSLAGSWRLSEVDSRYPGGFLRLQNETLEVKHDDGVNLEYTDSGLAPDGILKYYSINTSWTTHFTLGSDGSEVSIWHIRSREFHFIRRAPWDKYQIRIASWRDEICKISADGNRLACAPETGPQEHTLREVYDKVH